MSDGEHYDPPTVRTYECISCGARVNATHHPGTCPECGGDLQDISVPRE